MTKTKTSLFILPFIDAPITNPTFLNNFVNAYIFNEDSVILEYSNQPLFTNNYKVIDNKFYVKCNVKEKFLSDYHKFIEGKYSAFSTAAKLEIGTMYGMNSLAYNVVTKHPSQKKKIEDAIGHKLLETQEVYSIIGKEEYYNAKGE